MKVRRCLIVCGALLTLVGCAGPTPTVRPQETPNLAAAQQWPPEIDQRLSTRQKMVAIAVQEWQRWGRQQVRIGRDDTYCIASPSTLATTPPLSSQLNVDTDGVDGEVSDDIETLAAASHDSLHNRPCARFSDGSGAEATPTGCRLAQRYWAIVGRIPDCQVLTTGRWAWSATFLSWLMRQAGLTERQFLTGASHAMYVVDARDGILPDAAFGTEPVPALPAVGDVICSGRGRDKYINDLDEIRFGATPMHCDLVVEVDMTTRVIKAIGGNVQQAVSMSVIELGDSDQLDGVTNSTMPWLLVLRNQLP